MGEGAILGDSVGGEEVLILRVWARSGRWFTSLNPPGGRESSFMDTQFADICYRELLRSQFLCCRMSGCLREAGRGQHCRPRMGAS